MTLLTAKDREVLGLYAARMSTVSIARIAGGSEASVYNRLTRLEITSVGQALELLRSDDEARKAPRAPAAPKPRRAKPSPPPIKVGGPVMLTAGIDVAGDALRFEVTAWPAGEQPQCVAAGVVEPSLTPSAVVAPLSAPAVSPPAASPPAYSLGGLRLKPVTDRIARWAGHFLRARWRLQEVADLFDVAEDDLAQACGVLA